MAQGRGALMRLIFQRQTVARTVPTPGAKVMPFTSWGVQRDARRQANPSLNGTRLPSKSDLGDAVLQGPYSSILDLRSIGNMLMLAFGVPSARKAVANQPVNITGVTVHHAHASCPAGNGTLAWTASGTTLTWTPNGGSPGTPVNVSAGGNFTLQGGSASEDIRVSVVAGALPLGNQNDTINVHASLKAHVFPVNTDALPFGLFEAQHSDLSKFYRAFDCKLASMGWDILANDQNVNFQLIGSEEKEEASSFDGAPTSYAAVRACSAKAAITNGAGGLGTVVEGNIEINNNLTPYACGDGLEGYSHIDEGELMIGGTIRTVWDSQGAYRLARDGTSTRMRIETGAPVGGDIFRLVIDMPSVELVEAAPPKEGKSGLYVTNRWQLHQGADAPEIYLVNDVTSY